MAAPAPKVVFIGGGKMGEALFGGMITTGWAAAEQIGVVEPSADRRRELAAGQPDLQLLSVDEIPGGDVVLAVKPNHVPDVLASLRSLPDGQKIDRLLSIAAGVTTASIETGLGSDARVVRCMPNTPALVGKGASAIAGGTHADADDLGWAETILSSVGMVTRVPEALLDAVTGLSGSGPAYVFLVAEALVAAGIDVGLDAATADALARQTLLGAATLLAESGEDPAVLRANVTSPGGTTAEGIKALEAAGTRTAFLDAVRAATARSVELGAS